MIVEPIALADAQAFVLAHHRHSGPVAGHLYSLGLWAGLLDLRGVAIVGRPVNRHLDDGRTVEVLRVATDGTRNACSQLYGAARRRGYQRIVTYTLTTESGASLLAAGFTRVGFVQGRQWDTPARPRSQRPIVDKWRWESPTRPGKTVVVTATLRREKTVVVTFRETVVVTFRKQWS